MVLYEFYFWAQVTTYAFAISWHILLDLQPKDIGAKRKNLVSPSSFWYVKKPKHDRLATDQQAYQRAKYGAKSHIFPIVSGPPQAHFPVQGLWLPGPSAKAVQLVAGGRAVPEGTVALPYSPCMDLVERPLPCTFCYLTLTAPWNLALTNTGQACMFQTCTGHLKAGIILKLKHAYICQNIPCNLRGGKATNIITNIESDCMKARVRILK